MQRWILLSLVVVAAAAQKTEDQHRPDPRCSESLEVGDGTGIEKRYYYSAENSTCLEFNWKGGNKNGNNFETFVACYTICHPCLQITKRGGSLNKKVPHYSFSRDLYKCVSYKWPRCSPHGPIYSTLDDCRKQNCWGYRFCRLPKREGYPCYVRSGSFIPSYYYSTATKQCESFTYGGCGGNENNFYWRSDCQRKCSC